MFVPHQCCFVFLWIPPKTYFKTICIALVWFTHTLINSVYHSYWNLDYVRLNPCSPGFILWFPIQTYRMKRGLSGLKVSFWWIFVSLVCCEFKDDLFLFEISYLHIFWFCPSQFSYSTPPSLSLTSFMHSLLTSLKSTWWWMQVQWLLGHLLGHKEPLMSHIPEKFSSLHLGMRTCFGVPWCYALTSGDTFEMTWFVSESQVHVSSTWKFIVLFILVI